MGNMLPGCMLGCVCISVWKRRGLIYPQEYVGGKEVAEKPLELYENLPAKGSLPLWLLTISRTHDPTFTCWFQDLAAFKCIAGTKRLAQPEDGDGLSGGEPDGPEDGTEYWSRLQELLLKCKPLIAGRENRNASKIWRNIGWRGDKTGTVKEAEEVMRHGGQRYHLQPGNNDKRLGENEKTNNGSGGWEVQTTEAEGRKKGWQDRCRLPSHHTSPF